MSFKTWQPGCCCSNSCGCFLQCGNCQIPKNDLTMNFNPPWILKDGHNTPLSNTKLSYDGPTATWKQCIPGSSSSIFFLRCFNNNAQLQYGYGSTSGDCSTGHLSTAVATTGCLSGESFEIHYRNPPSGDFTVFGANANQNGYCVTICAATCNGAASGATIKVLDSVSGLVAKDIGNDNGCVTLNIKKPVLNGILEVDADGFTPFVKTGQGFICPNVYGYSFGCGINICLFDACAGPGISGAVVKIQDPFTGVIVSEGITASGGCYLNRCVTPPSSGVEYNAILTYAGQSQTKIFGCFVGTIFNLVKYRVVGCNTSIGLVGATVTYDGITQTTDANGYIDGILFGSDTNSAQVSHPPRFLSYPPNGIVGGSCTISLSANRANYTCCGAEGTYPFCNQLQLTDSVLGTCTLNFGGGFPGYQDPGAWNGYIMASFAGSCGCPAGTVPVLYSLRCGSPFGGPPSLGIAVLGSQTLESPFPCVCALFQALCPGNSSGVYQNTFLSINPPNTAIISAAYDPLDITWAATLGCSTARGCLTCAFGGHGPTLCGCDIGAGLGGLAYQTVWGTTPTVVHFTVQDLCP